MTWKEKILRFLKRNKGYAWTQKEIVKKVGASPHTVRSSLMSLLKEGLIKRKKMGVWYYFYIGKQTVKKSKKQKKIRKAKKGGRKKHA